MVAEKAEGFNTFLRNTEFLWKVKLWLVFLLHDLKMKYGLQCRGEIWTVPSAENRNMHPF